MGFDAGAAVVDAEAAGAGFGTDLGAGGVAFRGAAAVLAGAVGFFATAFAGFAEGAAVPRYGTVVVVGWLSLAAPGAAVGRAVPVYCTG